MTGMMASALNRGFCAVLLRTKFINYRIINFDIRQNYMWPVITMCVAKRETP